MKFTEQQIRESRCYGKPEGFLWVHPANKAIWPDGQIIETTVPERESDSDRLTPDEAVRLLRERGVIEDEPVAFKVGDRVEVVGPIDKFWGGYVPSLEFCIGLFGKITHVAGCTNLVDFGSVKWGFPASSLRHAKAEAAPAQPDKWAHLPEGGSWVHCPSAACIYHVTDLTFEAFELCGLTEGVVQDSRFRLVAGDTTITHAEAIAIFEANAAPDHIVDANKMVTDEAHYIQEACDWREANRVAEARIAVLEQQLADATASEGFARSQCQTAERAHAGITRQVRAMDEAITSARIRLENNGKVIDDLRKQASELTLQLTDARSSEGVTDAERASAMAAVDLMEQVEERDDTITDLRKQLANAEAAVADLMELIEERDATISEQRLELACQNSNLVMSKKCTDEQHLEMVRNRKQMDEYERTIDGLRKQAEGSCRQSVDNSHAILDDRVFLRDAAISIVARYQPGEIHYYTEVVADAADSLLASLKAREAKQ